MTVYQRGWEKTWDPQNKGIPRTTLKRDLSNGVSPGREPCTRGRRTAVQTSTVLLPKKATSRASTTKMPAGPYGLWTQILYVYVACFNLPALPTKGHYRDRLATSFYPAETFSWPTQLVSPGSEKIEAA